MRDDGLGVAAELAYRAFLAFVPFLIFVATLGAFVRDALHIPDPTDRLMELVGGSLPSNVTSLLHEQLTEIFDGRHPGLLSAGLVLALFAATGGTNALVKVINRAYGITETRSFWRRYVLALGITLLVAITLLAAVSMSIAARFVGEWLGLGAVSERLFGLATLPFVALLVFSSALLVYRAGPNIHVPLSCVVPGAIAFVASLLTMTAIFSFYVASVANYGATYGALASVVIFLIWLYLAAALLILGAELNATIADRDQLALVESVRRRARAAIGRAA